MKPLRLLFPAILALATAASPAFAQGGFNLFWDNCSTTGITNRTFACNTNTGTPFTMVASVVPTMDVPQLVGVEMRVFAMVNSIQLPSWWQTLAGQCRAGAISASFDPLLMPTDQCAPIWGDNSPVSTMTIVQSISQSSFEVRAAAAIPAPISIAGDATELNVGLVRLSRSASTGTGSCAGCLNSACFLLETVTLVQPEGVGDYIFQIPAVNNWIVYNGGIGLPSQCYVPAQNRSWGQIKSLYR